MSGYWLEKRYINAVHLPYQENNHNNTSNTSWTWTLTSDEEHGPAAEVFDGEDHVSSVEQVGLFDGQFVQAPVLGHLKPGVADHKLAVDSPGGLFHEVVGQKTLEGAVLPFQDRGSLQPLDNGDEKVCKNSRTAKDCISREALVSQLCETYYKVLFF